VCVSIWVPVSPPFCRTHVIVSAEIAAPPQSSNSRNSNSSGRKEFGRNSNPSTPEEFGRNSNSSTSQFVVLLRDTEEFWVSRFGGCRKCIIFNGNYHFRYVWDLEKIGLRCRTSDVWKTRFLLVSDRNDMCWTKRQSDSQYLIQGGEDPYDALSCRSLFARKEPLITGLFCGKWTIKKRHPMGFRHPVCERLQKTKYVSKYKLCLCVVERRVWGGSGGVLFLRKIKRVYFFFEK